MDKHTTKNVLGIRRTEAITRNAIMVTPEEKERLTKKKLVGSIMPDRLFLLSKPSTKK